MHLELAKKDSPMLSCVSCQGSGHVCERCRQAVPTCDCDVKFNLDTEEIAECKVCYGTGVLRAWGPTLVLA